MGCFDASSSTSHSNAPPCAAASSSSTVVTSNAIEEAPRPCSQPSSASASPSSALDFTNLYASAVQSSSYNEIWSIVHGPNNTASSSSASVQLVQPDRAAVDHVLQLARPTKLTRLFTDYFDRSEHTSNLCFLLQNSIDTARNLYAPLRDLLEHLPPSTSSSSFSQSQFDWAYDTLFEFYRHDNPFPSHSHFHDIRLFFSNLKLHLDHLLSRARTRSRLSNRSHAICLIGTAIGVAISAIVIATHALAALVAAPFIPPFLTFSRNNSQLQAASRGSYVLHYLDNIDQLVTLLHDTVESDRFAVRHVLDHGRERYPITEALEHIRKNQLKFQQRIEKLEEQICLCFSSVNRTRSQLLQEIHLHHTRSSQRHYLCLGD